MNPPTIFHVAVPGFVHSRAFRCIWLMEELQLPAYDVCLLDPAKPYAPQMRHYGVRFSHKVPTLQIEDQEIAESGVISQYLAETFNPQLLGDTDERLACLYWVSMAETCITFRVPLLPRLMDPGAELAELQTQAIEPMRAVFKANVEHFERHFEHSGQEFLLRSGFSIADTMCGWSLFVFDHWGLMDLNTGASPHTQAYLRRLRARSGFEAAERYASLAPGKYKKGGVAV